MRALGLLLLGLLATTVAAQPAVPAGTYRALAGGDVLHVRVATDGGVELFNPRDGRSAASKPLFSGARGITGILPGGESWSIGPTSRGLQMSLGARLFSLTALPAAEFGVREGGSAPAPAVRAPAPAAGAPATSALGGMSLSSARGVSGHRELTTLDLCSNGSVFYRVEELQSSQFGNAANVRTDSGTWSLAESTLHLRFARAGATRHALQRVADDVIALDGRRYAVQRSSRCR